jgi:small subunit ribosomal protein S6
MSKKTLKGVTGQPRYYETVLVIDPQIGDEPIRAIIEKVKEILTQQQATIIKVEEWGKRKLAYPINKKTYGFYVSVEFESYGTAVQPLLDYYHINEQILRFATTLVDLRLRKERSREKAVPKEVHTEDIDVI